MYIADTGNQRIRKVTISTGIITTVAGNGGYCYSGDGGAATSAKLCGPYGVALDTSGNVYISTDADCRIRKVTVSTGIITTLAGTGTCTFTFNGDNGPGTSAVLGYMRGIAVDTLGKHATTSLFSLSVILYSFILNRKYLYS